jgi:hypothetical protein
MAPDTEVTADMKAVAAVWPFNDIWALIPYSVAAIAAIVVLVWWISRRGKR